MDQPGGADGRVPPWWTDPTANVTTLVEAAMKRQDDLRELESKYVRELMDRDRMHSADLRKSESERIDAIQARSDLTVQRAAEVQATQAQALATQVATTADAFRSAMAAELTPVKLSIEDLRRTQYEAQGQKTQVIEARGDRGESRLNVGMLVGIGGLVIAAVTMILYIASLKG